MNVVDDIANIFEFSTIANFISAYEESQQNRDSHFLIFNMFFVSKGNLSDIYITTVKMINSINFQVLMVSGEVEEYGKRQGH